jgi:hypothetical protein
LNTLVPLELYSSVYFNILLLFVLILYSIVSKKQEQGNVEANNLNLFGFVFFGFVFLYMASRPISFVFADMGVYAKEFNSLANNENSYIGKDLGFDLLIRFCSKIMSVELFFVTCALLYILPLYLASKKYFGKFWVYSFFMLVISMSFWAYGTNGIRNGLATSFFIFALSRDKLWSKIGFIIIAVLFHKSLLLVAFAFVISKYYTNTKAYLAVWFLTIPLSLALGSFWETFFFNLGLVEENKLAGYLIDDAAVVDQLIELKVGFRWDFLLYSATGVFAGWFFIFKKKYNDSHYIQLYSMYLTVNAFWILVIRANYSNRFAYLSWFLLSIIIIYPLLKQDFFKNQYKVLGKIIFGYFMFTYLINFVFGN